MFCGHPFLSKGGVKLKADQLVSTFQVVDNLVLKGPGDGRILGPGLNVKIFSIQTAHQDVLGVAVGVPFRQLVINAGASKGDTG